MKTIKFILVVAFAFTFNLVQANGSGMNVVSLNEKKAYLTITNEEPQSFEIYIYNQQKELVYYKWVSKKTTDYRKVFDFSKLVEGEYTVKMRSKDSVIRKQVEIRENVGPVLSETNAK